MINIKSNNLHTVNGFYDKQTCTISYVVSDNSSKKCAVIDSVLDFDYSSGSIEYKNADKIISFIKKKDWEVEWLIETHVHADHLSASPYIQKQLGGKLVFLKKFLKFRIFLEKPLMQALNFKETEVSLTNFSKIMMYIKLGK